MAHPTRERRHLGIITLLPHPAIALLNAAVEMRETRERIMSTSRNHETTPANGRWRA
ncbi:hypothetical protein [Amycolatopsis acidicola]|uniref:hypothetical protein n=1 Tax=Amycolatopsis acidicola TaxID=2596893 RepID=UPI00140997CD|nr:hypothetical protein [Amycolatopsis acidicola]